MCIILSGWEDGRLCPTLLAESFMRKILALAGNGSTTFHVYCFIGREAGRQLAGAAGPQGFSAEGPWTMGRLTLRFGRSFGTFWETLDSFLHLGGSGYILLFLLFHGCMKFISNWPTYDDSGLHCI